MQQHSKKQSTSEVRRRARTHRATRTPQDREHDLELLTMISHDFRTPLTAILGYADLLDMGVPDRLTDGSREGVRRIRTSAKHLLDLLNEVLAFVRLDAGKEKANLMTVDARDVARDVAASIEPMARERGLEVEIDVPAAPVHFLTDPAKLHVMLMHLATNAVQYTAGGHVRIALRHPPNGNVEFEVSDTGEGIAPQHRKRIFEPFWQLDPTQRARGGGTGLGLSVAERLAKLLGTRITVRSEIGKGSVFTAVFPHRRSLHST